jgi:di/tricarboxylate transporter
MALMRPDTISHFVPIPMAPDIALCLAILLAAIGLFSLERIPADVIAVGVMIALVLTGILTPDQAFEGFASDTVITIFALLIMVAALEHTGVVERAGVAILNYAGEKESVVLPLVMVSVATLGAFISNTASTAFFIPVVLGFTRKIGASPSKYLMPLSFASIVTSSVTLISTSTNIVVSEFLTKHQLPEMGMFELAPVGIPIAVVGLLYILWFGVRMIPDRVGRQDQEDVGERWYQAELVVRPDSNLIGKRVGETVLGQHSGLSIVHIVRDGRRLSAPSYGKIRLQPGDDLVVEGLRSNVLKVKQIPGVDIRADVRHAGPEPAPDAVIIAEGVLMPHSPLIGETLRSAEFKDRYGLQVLGINRAGAPLPEKMSQAPLRLGDVLLLQGTVKNMKELERGNLFSIFGGVHPAHLNLKAAPWAVSIFVLAIIAATFKFVSLPVAFLGGAFLMLATRCISPEQAYRDIDWKVLILIGSLLSLGQALNVTGTGRFLAEQVIALVGSESPLLLLGCFFVLTVLLTQPMSNQAAAIFILPIALQTAQQLDLNPRTFAMMVAVAASTSYLTPLEPSSLMVYGPGRYRFLDFVKVGAPLTFVIFAIAMVLVPLVWPLSPTQG